MKKTNIKYYSLTNLLNKAPKADFYLIIGQRGNGKTVGVLKHFLNEYKKTKRRFCYIRRWDEDIKAYRAELFSGYLAEYVRQLFGEGFEVQYYRHKYYLVNENGTKVDTLGYVLTQYDDLMLRSGPGTCYPVIVRMPKGSHVTWSGIKEGEWLKVTYQHYMGWAHSNYLKL